MNKMNKILTLAAMAAVALTSCSNDEIRQVENDGVIRLGAGMVSTKAPVNSLADLSAVGDKVGIYAISTPWTAAPLMQNVQTTAIDGATGSISWTDVYNYPADGSNLTFYGYYPYVAEGTSGDNYMVAPDGTNAPVLNFTTDGMQDVMYATPLTANKTTSPVGKLVFGHTLTQLHFLAKKGTVAEGTKIKSITLKNLNSRCTLNMEDGTLGSWSTPVNMIALADADVAIPEAEEEITGATPLMIQPDLSQVLVDVVTVKEGTEETYDDIIIKPEGEKDMFNAGVSYAITLTFNSKSDRVPIDIAAGVTPWVESGKGSGTVE